jgi:acyl-CoA synthetase (AMP-forming)/AMP-acid ligase II
MPRLPLTTSYWPADASAPVLDTTIGGVLRAAAARAPDQPALIAGDPSPDRRRQWRYGELLAEAERGARALLARFRPGDRVAVWAGNCPEWVLLEFAAGLAGVTLVTINPAYQLLSHPGVADAAVVGVADRFWGEVVGAVIRAAGDAPAGEAELAEFCRARLAAFKVPSRWLFTGAFPLTATGKVRKDELSARLAGADGELTAGSGARR